MVLCKNSLNTLQTHHSISYEKNIQILGKKENNTVFAEYLRNNSENTYGKNEQHHAKQKMPENVQLFLLKAQHILLKIKVSVV